MIGIRISIQGTHKLHVTNDASSRLFVPANNSTSCNAVCAVMLHVFIRTQAKLVLEWTNIPVEWPMNARESPMSTCAHPLIYHGPSTDKENYRYLAYIIYPTET